MDVLATQPQSARIGPVDVIDMDGLVDVDELVGMGPVDAGGLVDVDELVGMGPGDVIDMDGLVAAADGQVDMDGPVDVDGLVDAIGLDVDGSVDVDVRVDIGPVDVDGTLAWREMGEGPVVVFLHGLGGTRTSWEPQLQELSDEFRCVAWDMPGYGASAVVEPLTFPAIADAVARLLDVLGTERAHLVGESFGGMHALHMALLHPDRVDRLVLTNTSSAFGVNGTDPTDWKASRLDPLDSGLTPADIAKPVLASLVGPAITPEAMAMRVAAFARIDGNGLRAAVNCLPDHDVRSELSAITAPALVVAGRLDAETPVAYGQALAEGMPNAELVVLEDVGHLSASEAPQTFNQLVRRFLRPGGRVRSVS